MRHPGLALLFFLAVFLAVPCIHAQTARQSTHLVPTGKGWGETSATPPARVGVNGGATSGIDYHGGPVMPGSVNLYFIWYGNFVKGAAASDSGETQTLLTTLFGPGGLGGSTWARINSTYAGASQAVTGDFALADSAYDYYSRGKNLTDDTVAWVVANAIGTHALPNDSNAVYFVLSSSDVDETSGLCTKYCGWHSHTSLSGEDIKIAFVGNPDRCPSACEPQPASPNGSSGADAMASTVAHQVADAITDPDLNAWYDTGGNESADKCAWKWGPLTGNLGQGAYNITVAGHNWLIQMNWENSGAGGCSQELGGRFYQR